MKYFTPELYAKLNSADEAQVGVAEEEWEVVSKFYQQQLEKYSAFLPTGARQLVTGIHLHDAHVLAYRSETSDRVRWTGGEDRPVDHFTIYLKTDESIVVVLYILENRITTLKHDDGGVFVDSETPSWLYDEMHFAWQATTTGWTASPPPPSLRSPYLTHLILLSDGKELQINFRDVIVQSVPLAVICKEEAAMEAAS